MTKHKTIVGLCMLCALIVSGFAAQSASAISGTTAFTCVKGGGDKALRGEHCLTTGNALQEYGHVAIAQDKTTEIIGTNHKTLTETTEHRTARLKVTVAGVPLELSATTVTGEGSAENKLDASGEHYAHGEGTITFEEVKVTQPAGRGCEVFTHKETGGADEGDPEVVHTRELTATTLGQGHELKFQPTEGNSFANFFVTCEEGKKIPAIEGTWECTGSVKGKVNGATTTFTHADTTAQNTLKCRGAKAGIDGALTISGREKGSAGSYTPLSATTLTT